MSEYIIPKWPNIQIVTCPRCEGKGYIEGYGTQIECGPCYGIGTQWIDHTGQNQYFAGRDGPWHGVRKRQSKEGRLDVERSLHKMRQVRT